jgi:hypothetical protein
VGAPIALSQAHWPPESKTVERSRGKSTVVARVSVAVAACVLWLFIGALWDNAFCGESDTGDQAFVVTEKGHKIARANAKLDESLLVSQLVETTVVEQTQIQKPDREKVESPANRPPLAQPGDASQGKAAQAPQSAPAAALDRKQALEQEWFARALTSSMRGELNEVRSAADAEIKQNQAPDQERLRADNLARQLTSLRAELDAARAAGQEGAQAAEAESRQRQALEQERNQERDRADALAKELTSLRDERDAAQAAAREGAQAAEAESKQKQSLEQERNQQRDRADALAKELTSLRAERDAAQAAGREVAQGAEAGIKQTQALEQERNQERDRADALARELTSLRAELDAARAAGREVAQAAEAESKQKKQALKQERNQERDRADALARELASLRAELDAARAAGREVAQAAETEIKQKQALEQERNQERDRANALAGELASLRPELDAARAAGVETAQTAAAAKIEQEQAFGKEREKTETLARELAAARKEAEARSALLAAAHAEALQVTETNNANTAEHERALTSERERADALARELTSARNELEADNRQIGSLNSLRAVHARAAAVDRSQERMARSSSRPIEVKGRSQEQISAKAAAFASRPSLVSELPRPEVPSAAREAAPDLVPNAAIGTERSTAPRAVSLPVADEQRLLARATALLGQADISAARPLLQHALERGSARAAFMLAETYDARVLQSWRANGISGDRTKARELYERAQAGGIENARERIEALK